jgi:IMP dehydrogenase
MPKKPNGGPELALTFDDVLLKPGLSDVLPSEVDIRTRITRDISINIPIIASAMDTVTEAQMAIAMAQFGGIGVIHRNLEPEIQAEQVRRVKRFESGMVVNPLTISPSAKLVDALDLMKQHGISGIPVVEGGGHGRAGKLVGILTNRDVRFATDPEQPVSELMTKDRLITVREGVTQEEAKKLLHTNRIEKLLVVDENYRCVGLITVKDIEKAVANPNAAKDEQGRLRVAAATTVGDKGFSRTEALIAAGVDLVVVDTAHGHSRHVLDAVNRIKRLSNKVQVAAGNIATAEGAKALIDAGADCRRWRAADDRDHGFGRGSKKIRYSGDRRRRHQVFGRSRQGARGRRGLRDGRLAVCRDGRDAGRGVPVAGPLLQGLSRHGLGRRNGARLGRSLLPAGHQGFAEARA